MKPKTIKAIEDHAIAEYPRESCGVVIISKRREVYVACRNIHEKPTEEFTIDPADLDAAEELGTVKAIVHSHPDTGPQPTDTDLVGCENSRLPWIIVAVHGDPAAPELAPRAVSLHQFAPSGYELPLRNRDYVFGVSDCYTLAQDFYKREMGVVLPDIERKDKFWERGEDLYMENFTAAGFDPIPAPTQKGDVILMAIRSDTVNHAAIWLGEQDHMLHHPYGHLSERVVYGGYWVDHTRLYIRKVR